MENITIPSGVQHVQGDVSVSLTSTITSFSAPGLQTISGTFELLNLTQLASVSGPFLSQIGSLSWVILPSLQTVSLQIQEVGSVEISDTQLSTLSIFTFSSVGNFGVGKFLR